MKFFTRSDDIYNGNKYVRIVSVIPQRGNVKPMIDDCYKNQKRFPCDIGNSLFRVLLTCASDYSLFQKHYKFIISQCICIKKINCVIAVRLA